MTTAITPIRVNIVLSIFTVYFRLIDARLGSKGTALIIFYFLSLDKNDFTKYAVLLSEKTTLDHCYAMAWMFTIKRGFGGEYNKIENFIRENCERNKWSLSKWLKTQSLKAEALFKPKAKANVQAASTN